MAPSAIKIAILAMGGEGGGVLSDWIVDLGEHQGHIAQSTSVAGVAQRTGATIYYVEIIRPQPRTGATVYYVELFDRRQAQAAGAEPVLALMPTPGDVDVVLASELMEAGRAVQRGLVTPELTTLIASTHRVYSIDEKSALGNGMVDSQVLRLACRDAARTFVGFDMAEVVERHGSVISAVLFGALCGSGVLPFDRADFEATIARGRVGVQASLRAFAAGFSAAAPAPKAPAPEAPAPEATASGAWAPGSPAPATPAAAAAPVATDPQAHADRTPAPAPPAVRSAAADALWRRLHAEFDAEHRTLLLAGVRRLVDYQDPAYAALYLDRVAAVARHGQTALTAAVARHLALWMSYEDTVRVADLKIRASRFERVRTEVKAGQAQLLAIDEYLHPRLAEVCDTLPRALGHWLLASGLPRRWMARAVARGRVVRTSSVAGFLTLYAVAGLRRWRRGSLRFHREDQAIQAWLGRIHRVAPRDPELAVQVAECQRLVKGYSDTLERGQRNFDAVMAAADRLQGVQAARILRSLSEAALADEHGTALTATLAAHGLM